MSVAFGDVIQQMMNDFIICITITKCLSFPVLRLGMSHNTVMQADPMTLAEKNKLGRFAPPVLIRMVVL